MGLVITIKNGLTCTLGGELKVQKYIYEQMKVKHPNAWHIRVYSKSKWDGMVKYVSDHGIFSTGLLPKVVEIAQQVCDEIEIVDNRVPIGINPVIPKKLGDLTLYGKQREALGKILNNKVLGVPFLICAGDYSVGFGKSLLFCAIHEAFKRKLKTILLLNDSDLFNQFQKEMPPMLPGEDICFIRGGKVTKWGNFNVAMVQSLSRNLRDYSVQLAQMDITLIDEADIIDNNTYTKVIQNLYNSRVRVGLSGTLYMRDIAKYRVHNMNVMKFIGPSIDSVTIKDQMNSGRATPVTVKMINLPKLSKCGDVSYSDEILHETRCEKSYAYSLSRTLFNIRKDRLPAIVVVKYIKHCEDLYKYYQQKNRELGLGLRITMVHHETKDRKKILEDFKDDKYDILIVTTIISRGKNIPKLRYLQNAGDLDSNEKVIQILGRLVRKHQSKKRAYLDDLIYSGKYLSRHGKHRKNYYKKQGLRVLVKDGEILKELQ